MQQNPPDKAGEPVLGSASQASPSSAANAISYSRDNRTVNQTPSTPLLLDSSGPGPTDPDGVPDVPPPSYEEATGIAPNAPSAALPLPGARRHSASANANANGPPQLPPRLNSNSLHIPGAFPRPAAGASTASAGTAGGNRRASGNAGVAAASGVYGEPKNRRRPLSSTGIAAGGSTSAGGAGSSSSSGRNPAPGSIPHGRQFPPFINLYGDNWARMFSLGEHQQTPLYAVRMRPSWEMSNPVIMLHNGPNPDTAPLLSAVDHVPLSDHMLITLPPPLTYTGTGSTAVRLDIVMGWSHHYAFTMEVGTSTANVHMETFEWRHSYGNAVAALGGAREGWKLVRMSTQPLPGAPRPNPAPGFISSDGREVVAMYSDARMSISKHLKFAFVGTGLSGALGERWAVMAVTSALGIWEKEEAVQNRR